MSAFLGPIHHWLFAKILRTEARAFAIADTLKAKNVDIDDLTGEYGDRLEGQDLGDLLGANMIHQFLQGLITRIQVFEAQLVERGGAEHQEAIIAAAEAHGRAIAGENDGAAGLAAITEAINNNQLEGMPCDPGASFTDTSETEMEYGHIACNHVANWRFTGVDTKVMCAVVNAWGKGLVMGMNNNASYDVVSTIVGGDQACLTRVTTGGNGA